MSRMKMIKARRVGWMVASRVDETLPWIYYQYATAPTKAMAIDKFNECNSTGLYEALRESDLARCVPVYTEADR